MRVFFFLLTSLGLANNASAHTSLIPHLETSNDLLHALIHTGISIVAMTTVYLIVRKIFTPKRISFKRPRQ